MQVIKSLFGKGNAAPLFKTVTAYLDPVAEFGKKRLYISVAAYVAVEYFVDQLGNVGINISLVYVGLVIGGGVGNIKIITAISVISGVYSV